LFDIIKELNFLKYLKAKEANLLMAWILTDTNVFYNTNVNPNTHYIAWELLKLWANSRQTIFEFFKKKTIIKTKLLWIALQNLQILYNKINWRNIVYTFLEEKDLKNLNATDKDTNWIIEHLINIENTEIAFIIYPLDKWWYKVSFRSQEYDVSALASKFSWGGHKQAAWFSSNEDIKTIIKNILELI
jgi:phosphoesterase RecJ-like protein